MVFLYFIQEFIRTTVFTNDLSIDIKFVHISQFTKDLYNNDTPTVASLYIPEKYVIFESKENLIDYNYKKSYMKLKHNIDHIIGVHDNIGIINLT
jgi:hypothetical protein